MSELFFNEIVYKINPIGSLYTFVLIHYFIISEGIIDMNIPQFLHIANNLTQLECSKLIASLQYTSYELPNSLEASTNNNKCLKQLIDYSEGTESWQGENKTHGVIVHRLRQLGRSDLADWLGNAVFHQLAKDINDALLNPFAEDSTPSALNTKLLKDKKAFVGAEWDTIDITLWMVLAALLSSLVFLCCHLLRLSCRKKVSTNEVQYYQNKNSAVRVNMNFNSIRN